MIRTVMLSALALLLIGCTARVTPPKVEIDSTVLDVEGDKSGTFCPPGQAKKGRC